MLELVLPLLDLLFLHFMRLLHQIFEYFESRVVQFIIQIVIFMEFFVEGHQLRLFAQFRYRIVERIIEFAALLELLGHRRQPRSLAMNLLLPLQELHN